MYVSMLCNLTSGSQSITHAVHDVYALEKKFNVSLIEKMSCYLYSKVNK